VESTGVHRSPSGKGGGQKSTEKQAHLLEEFKLGIWTKDEYIEKLNEVQGGGPPAKCQILGSFKFS